MAEKLKNVENNLYLFRCYCLFSIISPYILYKKNVHVCCTCVKAFFLTLSLEGLLAGDGQMREVYLPSAQRLQISSNLCPLPLVEQHHVGGLLSSLSHTNSL